MDDVQCCPVCGIPDHMTDPPDPFDGEECRDDFDGILQPLEA
jgi:hypothetical protein